MKYQKCKVWTGGSSDDLKKQWYVFYSFKNPETNKMQVFKIYISNRLKLKSQRYDAARLIIKKYDELLESGFNPFLSEQLGTMRLIEVMEELLRIRDARNYKLKSKQTEKYVTGKFIEFLKQNNLQYKKLEDFSKHNAQQYFDYLLTTCNLSHRTCNNHLMFMRTFFNEIVRRDYIQKNVFSLIKKLPETESTVIAYSNEQMDLIRRNLKAYDKELFTFTQFIYYACMRPIEITRLKRKNLDLDNGLILVDSLVSKTRRQQSIRISDNLMKTILENNYDKLRVDDYLFSVSMKPGIMYRGSRLAQKRWKAFADTNGLQGCQMYWLKHTANGHMLDLGLNVKEIKDHNRHQSLDQTMAYLNRFRNLASDKINLLDGF